MKKTISVLLAAAFMFSLFACGETKDGITSPAETTSAAAADVPAEETTTELAGPELPDMTFDDKTITIYKREGDAGRSTDYVFDELTGDVEDDAIYYRNLAVEEKFAVDIKEKLGVGDTFGNQAKNSIMSGEDAYQMVSAHARTSFQYSDAGLALDWYELPYVNFENEWWDKNTLNSMTIGGKIFVLPDDLSTSSLEETKCYFFNKDLFKKYNLEFPYQAVRDGVYTFDRFNQDCSVFSYDLDGDGNLKLQDDQYGFSADWWETPINIVWTAGLHIVSATGEGGRLEITLDADKADDVYTKMFSFFDDNDYAILERANYSPLRTDAFRQGRLAMMESLLNRIVQFRDMDDDIGCVPPPKFYEEMTVYYTGVDAGCSAITIPVTNGDVDMLSAVLEYWMYLQYRDVVPVYFDTVCKTKVARDEETAEMLDLIRSIRVFDLGYYLESFALNSIGQALSNTKKGFAAYYESNLSKAQKSLDKINELYFG
ncbi:MAG: ABC transporter substrate-binding protein [Clostridiales bacterium]|nr:ABC transporter substrate-binding protein [Clostridiales bacterium]